MRLKLLIPLAGALALTACCLRASAAPPTSSSTSPTPTTPAIAAKKAEAARVLNEIASIDEQLNTVSEQFDGARIQLAAVRTNLKSERIQLAHARVRYKAAEARAAKLLVWLYTSSHSNALDVILGANSLSQLLRLSDAENALSNQAAIVTRQAQEARSVLTAHVHATDADRKLAQVTVHDLAMERSRIMHGLAERRRLLASVQSQVDKLEAQERARQARLAAEAAARLRAEAAARAKAEAAAQARTRAEAAAAAKAKAQVDQEQAEQQQADAATTSTTQTTTQATTTTAAATTPTTPTAAVDTTPPLAPPPVTVQTTTTTPAVTSGPTPTGPLPAGHPEAAQIALQYLGIPYLWGGASPKTGFDCSGLVTYVYAQLGITLPHFAAAQWGYGVPVPKAELQPGDLVFFDALDHVGIYLGDNEFVDAPHTGAFVRIDSLSEPWYANHYVGARRI